MIMKKIIVLSLLVFALFGKPASAGSDFDKLKALEGQWDATTPEGKSRVIYQVVSNGTALMETIVNEHMISVYHPDGNSILMTHYCAAGNQPRMRAQGWKGNTLSFRFVDVANLKSPSDGYMSSLTIKLEDADHVTAEWTYKDNGKETTYAFHLQRVK